MMKRFKSWLYARLDSRRNSAKKKLKLLGMSVGLVSNSPLLLAISFGDSDSLAFKKVIDLLPFHVFLILLIFILKLLF